MDGSLKLLTCFVTWAKFASSRAHGSWSFCHKCKMYYQQWFAAQTLKRLFSYFHPSFTFSTLDRSYGFKYLLWFQIATVVFMLSTIVVVVVQLLSCVQLFGTPWTAAHQASPSITNSQSLLKLMSIELMMPSNNLALCHPFLLPPSIFPSISVFQMSQFLTPGGQSIGV